MKKVFFIIFLLSVFRLSFAEWFNGENLIQPTPIPGRDWQTSQTRDKNYFQHTWSRDNDKDMLQTNIYYHTPYRDVFSEKQMDSEVGKKNCKLFNIEEEEGKTENGYPTLSWLSKCHLDDESTITILHKVISGNSSFYHLKKIWLKQNDADELDLWRTYFSAVSICDTRYQEHRCPL